MGIASCQWLLTKKYPQQWMPKNTHWLFFPKQWEIPRIQSVTRCWQKLTSNIGGKRRKIIPDFPSSVLKFVAVGEEVQRKSKPLLTCGSEKPVMLTPAERRLPCCHSLKAAGANQTHPSAFTNFSSAKARSTGHACWISSNSCTVHCSMFEKEADNYSICEGKMLFCDTLHLIQLVLVPVIRDAQ